METSWKAVSKQAIATSESMWGQLCIRRLQLVTHAGPLGFGSAGLHCTLSIADPKADLESPQMELPSWQQAPGAEVIKDSDLNMVLTLWRCCTLSFSSDFLRILSPVFFPLIFIWLFFFFNKSKRSNFLMVLLYFIRFLCLKFSMKEKRFSAPSICVKITWSYDF